MATIAASVGFSIDRARGCIPNHRESPRYEERLAARLPGQTLHVTVGGAALRIQHAAPRK
eukprot:CAMPEP_0175031940 /NCGR_PEP_ID=MMETSP0005-20121125/21124_1 /TAXON_ID=420556 /ORGANISM="Ochromonas sp., Strain CCMP1393" /LENGTH=59 /DNA_ID=CAMNT_0016292305 /DNA_START=108 /DNA_END=290 /DNA_ORIENTATION=-